MIGATGAVGDTGYTGAQGATGHLRVGLYSEVVRPPISLWPNVAAKL